MLTNPQPLTRVLLLASVLTLVFLTVVRAQDATLAPAIDQIAVVGARGVALQATLTQASIAQLAPGVLLTVKARSADGQLLYVQTETRQVGWVMAGTCWW